MHWGKNHPHHLGRLMYPASAHHHAGLSTSRLSGVSRPGLLIGDGILARLERN